MNNETQILAAKLLAQIITSEENQPKNENSAELTQILAKLDEFNGRLAQIENRLEEKPNDQQSEMPNFIKPSFPVFIHSSQERFTFDDANGEEEKACRFEPGGKPCDHCSMCSARGF